jgi:tryptophan-rich sensory protein
MTGWRTNMSVSQRGYIFTRLVDRISGMFFKVWLPLIALTSFIASILFAAIYQRIRRPDWAPTAAAIQVPWAGWIIAAILAVVIALLAFLMSRDPLQGPY